MWSATCMTSNHPNNNCPSSNHPNSNHPNSSYPDDDGRVVADMSQVVKVGMLDLIAPEGLRTRLGGRRPGFSAGSGGTHPGDSHPGDSMNQSGQNPHGNGEPIELTEGELKALMKASLKAALLLAGVFIGAAGLFILFCVFVWFR
jgi:hypothetical protein